ncbi:MAG: guanylate kinase [Firmicutes bacterium]|nr:guanylate kinase [Bacillota bacterium]
MVVSGPSGSGKNRVISEAMKVTQGLRYSISATTRPRRLNERDGVDYHFVSLDRFQDMIRQDDLLEYAEVYGNFYGTPRKPVEDVLAAGEDVILDLDVQGALQIRQRCPDAVLVFLLPPSIAELERRIRSRGTDDEATIRRRMNSALNEISALSQYTYAIVNDELEDAVRSLVAIIEAERCRTSRFVRASSDEMRSQSISE